MEKFCLTKKLWSNNIKKAVMKKNIFILFAYLIISTTFSFSQSWQWAKKFGGISLDDASSPSVDGNGNLYFIVTVQKPTAFFQTDSFTINGDNDFFLVKYDSSGNELWVKQFGGPNTDWLYPKGEGASIVFDSISGSIFMAGGFVTKIQFDSTTLITSYNDKQMFIARFDLNGNCMWVKSAGGPFDDVCTIFKGENGSLLISGQSAGGTFDAINFTGGGFIAKYDNNGNCLWVKKIFNYANNSYYSGAVPYSLRINNSDIYLTGENIEDTFSLDTISIQTNNYYGIILARLDSLAQVKWYKMFGGNYTNGKLYFDKENNFYISGNYGGGSAIFDSDTLTSNAVSNFYLAKFDENGNKIWLRQAENSNNKIVMASIYIDDIDNIFVSGNLIGSATIGNFTVNASTEKDAFIAKYNKDGNCTGVINFGKAEGCRIAGDNNGLYITGNFYDTILLGSTSLTSYGGRDGFVGKHDTTIFTSINIRHGNTNTNQLLIYANPNTGKCNITVPDEFLKEENLTLQIFDNNGKLIQQQNVVMEEEKIKINLEAEAKGVYNVTLGNKKKSYGGKILFE